jgi:DNA polymerase-3 subunit delta'
VPTLAEISGQERVISVLTQSIAHGRVPHAYLFAGPVGAPLLATAKALAAAQNCEVAPGKGCGTCASCERIAEDRHPDVITLKPEGAAQIIPIETIRKEVVPALGLAPHEGKTRWFLVEEAAALPGPSANALLKSLEEPPARTHFVLCTSTPDAVLPTIRSRCQRLLFDAGDAATASAIDEDQALISAAVDRLAVAAQSPHIDVVLETAAEVASHKDHVSKILVALAARYHRQAKACAQKGELRRAEYFAACGSRALTAETQVVLHNVHKQTSLEHMLFDMRRLPGGRELGG